MWVAVTAVALTWASRPGSMSHSAALAGMTASNGGFTLLTAGSRDQRVSGEAEVVYVIDHHRGMMLVYGLTDLVNAPDILLLDGGPIEVLFERARRRSRAGAAPAP